MTRERPQQPRALEEEGVPDLEGPLPEKEQTGDAQEGVAPPGDQPGASDDHGTTAAEQREGLNLDEKLAREEAERRPEEAEPQLDDAGRLVTPEEGAQAPDREKDEVAREGDHEAPSSEEDAVRSGEPR